MFGLFILNNGTWHLHTTDATLSHYLLGERDYLVKALGLTASIFRKL